MRVQTLQRKNFICYLILGIDERVPTKLLNNVQIFCMHHNITVLLAWSEHDAASYLCSLQKWSNHQATGLESTSYLKDRKAANHTMQAHEALASIRKMTSKCAGSLLKRYGSIRNIVLAKDYNEFQETENVSNIK
jgi:ERCC4-type nuclease